MCTCGWEDLQSASAYLRRRVALYLRKLALSFCVKKGKKKEGNQHLTKETSLGSNSQGEIVAYMKKNSLFHKEDSQRDNIARGGILHLEYLIKMFAIIGKKEKNSV